MRRKSTILHYCPTMSCRIRRGPKILFFRLWCGPFWIVRKLLAQVEKNDRKKSEGQLTDNEMIAAERRTAELINQTDRREAAL
jgi:hypothetical protein